MQPFQFHPAVARWFTGKFGSPTEPQARGWPAIQSGQHTLIAAPTGSGKTLAAFLAALDDLFRAGLSGKLPDETRVVYVSPLKALSNDIHKNLEEPLVGIRAALVASESKLVNVRAAVRTGDTSASQRQAIAKKPPHILVTTPESLYLLLTSLSGRRMLSTVRTLIVDEIHAVVGNRRGSHLALSMERLAALVKKPLQRIGLSATQKPIEEVARFLVGSCNASGTNVSWFNQLDLLDRENVSEATPANVLLDTPAKENFSQPACAIIDAGHSREMDLAIELPGSPLEAVMSNEVWAEVYLRIAEFIEAHRTTLVFVNTRRLAERVTHQLTERLGKDCVMSHHGSLSTKLRLDAENRLKRGELKALVATASLELGIDIGAVDLVCQIGPTRSIATFLQRVGRAEHKRGGLPKGRLFPLSRDELAECVALLRSVRGGELDRLVMPEKPLDVLAQQIVACVACEDCDEETIFERVRAAYPYRHLTRAEFDDVLRMLADGFSTKRGRRGALVHHDTVNHRVRGRRGARLLALQSGGAIPDTADYRVVVDPTETFIGTVNEDFAIESSAGDIFQLGNASWKILQVNSGQVRVQDAQGQPPTIPFWLGEAPGRTRELSSAVSKLREDFEKQIQREPVPIHPRLQETDQRGVCQAQPEDGAPSIARQEERMLAAAERCSALQVQGAGQTEADSSAGPVPAHLADWLVNELSVPQSAATQLADYFNQVYKVLGVVPSQRRLVMERFFDESGGMQLVLHAPFGIRINRAWGLALRKRFCRSFNFELQAAATDDAIVISLGTQHSFPLEEVFRYLNSKTVRDLLVQALLDAPMFPIRWRWNATRALALPRMRGGRRTPAPLQRMESENLLAAVFPDQLACLEHIVGDREIPDHPLVFQTIEDCLTEAMDIEGLIEVLQRIESNEIECIARDLPEPSPLAHEILHAKPYAFLDNAPLEERRTQAVITRRAGETSSDAGLGILDSAAIDHVGAEAWPAAANADELHEALLLLGLMSAEEIQRTTSGSQVFLETLVAQKRAAQFAVASNAAMPARELWVAAERLPMLQAIFPDCKIAPAITPPESERRREWERADAMRELVRGRMEVLGPVTAATLVEFFELKATEIDAALLALEAEGFVLRGRFHAEAMELEWCDRRLLARIHRLTLNRLRAEIQPVSLAEFQRFLLAWQRVGVEYRAEGPEGVEAVLDLLDGYELPAAAWEPDVLALRVKEYTPAWLDRLCFTGRIGWGRLTPPQNQKARAFSPLRSSPVSLFTREKLPHWLELSASVPAAEFSPDTGLVFNALKQHGALFFAEIVRHTRLLPSRVEQALGELSAQGWVTADSFEGMRALLIPSEKRAPHANVERQRRHKTVTSIEFAGRWSLLRAAMSEDALAVSGDRNGAGSKGSLPAAAATSDAALETFARVLLRRYGVMFRRLLERESLNASWFELGRVYRRLEARGEIRGGHFVAGVSGEQFALPEAIGLLRGLRKKAPKNELLSISAADPLNLAGILTPGPRITSISANRILLRDGLPIAALEAGEIIKLERDDATSDRVIEMLLRVGNMAVSLRPYYA
ncbi:MAG: DEAD/DEAH box helicase [Verrucomicrobia bacterium]|nr:DEAD/DEAH box helicase [Verrucomicrobiota bacterium]